MDMTILRARIIAITFMAGLAWSEGHVPDVQAGDGVEETIEARQLLKTGTGSLSVPACSDITLTSE